MQNSDSHGTENAAGWPLSHVLAEICRNPKRFLFDSWNWKAASLSVLYRAPIFIISTARHGLQTMVTAGILESIFRILITGVDASITQGVKWAEPQWMVAIVVLAVIPGGTVALESVVHWLAATPNLRAGLAASLVLSVFASAFNWFSMRKGALLVGRDSSSFATDLASMPTLIGRFVASPALFVWRGVNEVLSRNNGKTPEMLGEKSILSSGESGLTDASSILCRRVSSFLSSFNLAGITNCSKDRGAGGR